MTLAWAFALGLAGLAAVLVPLLLHLDRRRTVRTLVFAAMQWIDTPSRPRRTWRITEWLLLALRLLLLIALALWLAHPLLHGGTRDARRVLAVAPGAAAADIAAAIATADHSVWLADGLPAYTTTGVPASGNVASLLRELDASLAADDALQVLVPRQLDGLDATAIALSREVEWTVSGNATPEPAADVPSARRSVVVRHEAGAETARHYLDAAIAAWNTNEATATDIDSATAGTPLPAQANAIVWIGATPDADVEARVADGARLLRIPTSSPPAADTSAAWPPTFARSGRGTRADLAATLEPRHITVLQSAQFPEELRRALFPDETSPPTRALASDVQPSRSGTSTTGSAPESLRAWLALAIAVLFLLERLLATARRLARAA